MRRYLSKTFIYTTALLIFTFIILCFSGCGCGKGKGGADTEKNADKAAESDALGIYSPGGGTAITTLTDEAPGIYAYVNYWAIMDDDDDYDYDMGSELKIDTKLYSLKSFEDYMEALETMYKEDNSYSSKRTNPCKGMDYKEYASFKLKAGYDYEGYSGAYYAEFPKALDKGWYLGEFTVKIKGRKLTRYKLIQSTNISYTASAAAGELLSWTHDAETGKAVNNAEIEVSGGYIAEGSTDADGVSRIPLEYSGSDTEYYNAVKVSVKAEEGIYGDILTGNISNDNSGYVSNVYYNYIVSDRTIYKPDDKISFFGVLRYRYSNEKVSGKEIKVKLGDSYYSDSGALGEADIELRDDGTFKGTIDIKDAKSGYYSLSVYRDDIFIGSTDVTISDYVKPEYKGTAKTDKIAYINTLDDEKEAKIDLNVSYYDETPAVGFKLEKSYSSDKIDDKNTMETDSWGNASTSVDISGVDSDSWRPVYNHITYTGGEAEDENLYLTAGFYVFTKDTMLLGENDADKSEFKFSAYDINTDNIRTENDVYKNDVIKGDPYEGTVDAVLYKRYFEKKKTGTQYDAIYKKERNTYEYVEHNDKIDSFRCRLDDGTGTISYDSDKVKEEIGTSYYLECTMNDHKGNKVKERFYLWQNAFRWDSTYDTYAMTPDEPGSDQDDEDSYYGYGFKFKDGEDKAYHLTYGGEPVEMGNNEKLLAFTVLPDGINDLSVSKDGALNVKYTEKHSPNYEITGVYFDGKHTHILDTTNMKLDTSDKKLDIKVTSDKENYAPKETAKISVSVTDAQTGEPVSKGTEVMLSMVDEAVFALSDQDVDILNGIYASRELPYVCWFMDDDLIPYDLAKNESTAAATGEDSGGSSYVREDFKDTAYFEVAQTDSKGCAYFEVKFPDNTTTWRVTTAAITGENHAGDNKDMLVSTLPYYVTKILNDTIIEGEPFAIGLRSAGADVEKSDACTYEVTVEGDDYSETKTVSSNGIRKLVFAEFTGLKSGEYSVTVTGKCRDYTDAVKFRFDVVDSGLELYTGVTQPVSEELNIAPVRYPVDIFIYDKSAMIYNMSLGRMLCSRNIRADERIASYWALKERAQDDDIDGFYKTKLDEADISDLNLSKGMLKLLPGDKEDIELTAIAYIAAKELVDPNGYYNESASYMIADYDETPVNKAAYNMLLAASGDHEYDAANVEKLYKKADSFKEKAYLMTAMYLGGDKDKAEEYYSEAVNDAFKEAKALSGETAYYIDEDSTGDSIENTAAALVAASVMQEPEDEYFAGYVLEKISDKNIYPLQLMIFAKNHKENESGSAVVSYELNGERTEETISGYAGKHLYLNREEFENLDLTNVSGEAWMNVFYIGTIQEAGKEENNLVKVDVKTDKKSYKVGDQAEYTIKTDLSKLDTDMGSRAMLLDVYVPSGMRFVDYSMDDDVAAYLVSREGQRLRFVVYGRMGDKQTDTTEIKIRLSCVTPGEYTIEKVYASSIYSDIYGLSERGTVKIGR